jgi:hypothetical protein
MAGLAAILLPSFLHAQITFQRTYGDTWSDVGHSVQQTADGGYIIAGYTDSYGAGFCDVYLVKTDANGDTLWTRTFGGRGDDYGESVQQTSDSGYVIAGITASFGAGGADVYLIRTDADGETLWTRTFGGVNYDWGSSVQQTSDGGYIVVGSTESYGAGGTDVYLIKTDAVGDTLWTRTFGGSDDDWGSSVQEGADGNYVIVGRAWPSDTALDDVFLVKTNAHGDTLLTRTFGGTDCDYGYSVQQTTDSGYVISGFTGSFGAGLFDVYLIKTDANVDTMWTKTFGGAGDDRGYSVQQTADGGYIVAGTAYLSGAGDTAVYLVKTDADGYARWTRTFGGTEDDYGYSVQQTADGGYIIAGETFSYGAGWYDAYLIKTDADGHVAVAEPSTSPTRAPSFSLTCEPNPCRGATTIHLTPFASRHSPLALRIYDAQGRRVRTLTVNRTPCTVWDGKDDLGQPLPTGTYFCRLITALGQTVAQSVVLVR